MRARGRAVAAPLLLAALAAGQRDPARYEIRGRVLDTAGRAIAGAGIAAGARGALCTRTALEEPAARTDAEGRFALRCDAAAPAPSILVAAPGKAALLAELWRRDGDLDIGTLVLLGGRTATGTVRDAHGEPVAGAFVVALDLLVGDHGLPQPSMPCAHFSAATTAEDGTFELPCVPDHGLAVRALCAGFLEHRIVPADPRVPLEITLAKGGEIAGRVVDAQGRGIRTTVYADYEIAADEDASTAETGEDGSFRLPLLRPTRYRVSTARPFVGDPTSVRSEPALGEVANLRLRRRKPIGHLDVRAFAQRGEPLRSFEVEVFAGLRPQDPTHRYFTPGLGMLRTDIGHALFPLFDSAHRRGSLKVRADGFAAVSVPYELDEASPVGDVTVRLQPEARIEGRVLDAQRRPVAGALVWAARPPRDGHSISFGGIPKDPMRTDESGRFSLPHLGDGPHHVYAAEATSLLWAATDVEAKSGMTRTADLVMPAPLSVHGKITGARDLPATLHLKGITRPERAGVCFAVQRFYTADVDADGRFALTGLGPGTYEPMLQLHHRTPGGTLGPCALPALEIAADRELTLEAPELRLAQLRGRVVLAGDEIDARRLAVVAAPKGPRPLPFPMPPTKLANGAAPAAAVLDGDLTFALDVLPGPYEITLREIATGHVLAALPAPLPLAAGQRRELELRAHVREVTVELVPDRGGAHAVVGHVLLVPPERGRPILFPCQTYLRYDRHGLPLEPAQRVVRLLAAPGRWRAFALSRAGVLRAAPDLGATVLGERVLEVPAEGPAVFELPVGPPIDLR